jgi:hypothetical protein
MTKDLAASVRARLLNIAKSESPMCFAPPELTLIENCFSSWLTWNTRRLGLASRRCGALEEVVAITEGENAKDGEVHPEIPG